MTRLFSLFRLCRIARMACRWRPPIGIRRLVVLEPELGTVLVDLILMVYGEPVMKRVVLIVDGDRERRGWREALEKTAEEMLDRVVAEAIAEGQAGAKLRGADPGFGTLNFPEIKITLRARPDEGATS